MTTALPPSLANLTPKQQQDFWASVAARDQTYGNNAGYEPQVGHKLQWINNAKDSTNKDDPLKPALASFADNSPNLAGWTIDSIISNDQFNTRIVIYKNANTGDVMVVPMGTDGFGDLQGWLANIKDTGLSQWTVQSPKGSENKLTVQDALFERVAEIYDKQGAQLIFTGDSKGGALIQVMAYQFHTALRKTDRFKDSVIAGLKNTEISLFGSVAPSATDAIRREIDPNYNPTSLDFNGILAIFTSPVGELVSKLGGMGRFAAGEVEYTFSEGLKNANRSLLSTVYNGFNDAEIGIFDSYTYLHRMVNGFYDFAKATNGDLSKVKQVTREPLYGGYFDDALAMFAKLGLGDGSQNGFESGARMFTAFMGALAFGPMVPFAQVVTDTSQPWTINKTLLAFNRFMLGGVSTGMLLPGKVAQGVGTLYVVGALLQTASAKGRDAVNAMFGKQTFGGTDLKIFNDQQFLDFLHGEMSKLDVVPVLAIESGNSLSVIQLSQKALDNTITPNTISQIYQIKQGDTISQLAQTFGVSEKLLLAYNPQVKNKDLIFKGDNLVVPIAIEATGSNKLNLAPELQQASASDLSKILGFDINALKAANPTVDFANLPQSQTLYLPTKTTNFFRVDTTGQIVFDSQAIETAVNNTGMNFNTSIPPTVFDLPKLPVETGIFGTLLGAAVYTPEKTEANPTYISALSSVTPWQFIPSQTFYLLNGRGTTVTTSAGYTGFSGVDATGTTKYVSLLGSPWQDTEGKFYWSGVPADSAITAGTNFVNNSFVNNMTKTYLASLKLGDLGFNADPLQALNFDSSDPANSGVNLSFQQAWDFDLETAWNQGFGAFPTFCVADPIIWDINNDGFNITSAQTSNVHFDVDNDGYYEKTAWFSSGANQDAALAIDLNGNGKVDGAWELVSEYFNAKPGSGKTYANGFAALAQFDQTGLGGNGDGKIDSADLISRKLFWWRDNGDGIDQSGEHINFTGSLSLTATAPNSSYNGSLLAQQSTLTGSTNVQTGVANGTNVGQFYFNAYDKGVAFSHDASGATYTLSEATKQIGIVASGSNNTINMSDKNLHTANAGAGNDSVTGTTGDDFISGGTGSDTLNGGAGNDTLYIDAEDKLSNISGGDGFDTLVVTQTSSVNIAMSAMGVEQIIANNGDDIISGVGNSSVFVKAGAGTDVVMGSNANDILSGGDGDDLLMGGAGTDVLRGEAGDDTLIGGANTDWMYGSTGNDTYVVDVLTDSIIENSNEGVDSVQTSVSYTLGANVENLALVSTAAINGTGNTLNNNLLGNNANNVLMGLAGDDTLEGSAGIDTLVGGLGDDIYVVDSTTDLITEILNEGVDTVQSSVSYVLGANLEALTLTGSAANGTGNVLVNTIIGNTLNNILDGGVGADTLSGGLGDDTYLVDNALDVITENTAEGLDTVQSTLTYSLFSLSNFENLTLLGAATTNATGNTLNNVLIGNSANNVLDGSTGKDTLIGGLGNDTYLVDNISDVIRESNAEGTDSIQSNVSYTLSDNVENLTLLASPYVLSGTGNSLNNMLTGSTVGNSLTGLLGDDTLDGGGGADGLFGGLGNDTYVVDNVGDVITEGVAEGADSVQSSVTYSLSANVENLTLTGTAVINGTGNLLNNVLTGNIANNVLDGGVGADTLTGGLGNDSYVIDNTSDVIIENIAEGLDSVHSAVTYSLSANVENLTLTGAAVINGTGSAVDNILIGNSANNVLTGLLGNDTLNGGVGADTLIGGLGNDAYLVDNTSDAIAENSAEGLDSVQSVVTYSLSANVENLTLTGSAVIDGTGSAVDNVLTGNSANNALTGLLGNDTLDGGVGADTLIGGAGNDTYVIDNALDVVSENIAEGIDSIKSSLSYTLSDYLENLTLSNYISPPGYMALNGTGNSADNILIGNETTNTLTGLLGNDTLDGGLYADTLVGGLGNDTYIVDNAGDIVRENSLEGTDGILSSVSYNLTANVENLTLTGAIATYATGNTLDNVLTGNSINNTLSGQLGNDTLDGGAGADSLLGGAGNDTYFVDNTADVITEILSEGTDSVQSTATYVLSANVENLTLVGVTAINGTGNALDNLLTGNTGVNVLTGQLGNDTLDGGAGADSLFGGAGNDTYFVDNTADVITEILSEGIDSVQSTATYVLTANVENLTLVGATAINGIGNILDNVLTGNSANNTLTGLSGNDTLNGGTGADTLVGGVGDDTYFVENTGDAITELLSEGTDYVQSTISYSLSANVENLMLTGTATINGTGNASNNVLTGNGANNTLDGSAGADSLIGGLGNDTYIVDNVLDVVTENLSAGMDIIRSSVTYILTSNVEYLTLTGSLDTNGTGNELNNILIGNSANNALVGLLGNDVLNGGIGADTLVGGLDSDTYVVDDAGDIITELVNEGTDSVQSSLTYSLTANVENLTLTGALVIDGTGNELNNYLTGNSANNTLTGLLGNDTLNGGIGADSLVGGLGNDAYIIDNVGDIVTELVIEGTDVVYSSLTYSLGANVENLTLTGDLVIDGIGNELNNYLKGNSANNMLTGLLGNDALNGGVGADSLIGGLGNDLYYVDSIGDIVTELVGEGTDMVYSSLTYGLTANVENLTLTGALVIDGTGNDLNNYLAGNTANNKLTGLLGNDILNGGAGADSLIGGLGDDLYYVDDVLDVITENAAEGIDRVQSSVTYSLSSNAENLTLTGNLAINGTGNSLDNVLTGNSAKNVITAQLGNDTLDGGLGSDILYGGAGNDTYMVDDVGDKVIEVDIRFSLRGDLTAIGLTSSGTPVPANSLASNPIFSPDGQRILFSGGGGKVTGDTNGKVHIFIKDLLTGEVTCVSTNQQGQIGDGHSIGGEFSPDGKKVLFLSDAPNMFPRAVGSTIGKDILIKDLQTGSIERVNEIAYWQGVELFAPYFVGNSRQVAFSSRASNLVPQDVDENSSEDVFIKNLDTGVIRRISKGEFGPESWGASGIMNVSSDGTKVAFMSSAGNLVSEGGNPILSVWGSLYVKDLNTGNVARVDTPLSGAFANHMAQDRGVRFSADGTKIAFVSEATNLVDNDTNNAPDVFVKNLITGQIQLAAMRHDGLQANSGSVDASFSPDGTKVMFTSGATNLVDRDINNNADVFIKDLITGEIYLADTDAEGVQLPSGGGGAEFSPDGTRIVFGSAAVELSNNQGFTNMFIKNLTVSLDDGGIDTVRSSINYTLGEYLENLVLTGTAAINGFGNSLNNTVTGNSGSNVITGGFGNDSLTGGLGNDTYRFSRGNGVDTIVDVDSTAANTDTLQFLGGVNHDQLWFSHVGNDLQVSIIGTSDKVIIQNWYSGATYRTEQIRTTESSENTLAAYNVELLVAAMAGFVMPSTGQTTLNTAQHTALDGIIATAWS